MFDNGKLEEFLQIMKDFKTATDGIETTYGTKTNQFLLTILCRDVNQWGFNWSIFHHQHNYQAETRNETRNAKTSRSPNQDIFRTTNGNE